MSIQTRGLNRQYLFLVFILFMVAASIFIKNRTESMNSFPDGEYSILPSQVLRKEPAVISKENMKTKFNVDVYKRPLTFCVNKFRVFKEGVIIDSETGLMWQQSGSKQCVKYEEINQTLDALNSSSFAGYNDWRLPTVPELMSLIREKRVGANGLHIEPIFDNNQIYCWTSDTTPDNSIWMIDFFEGSVYWGETHFVGSIRAVRSVNKENNINISKGKCDDNRN